jgi:hypothetical protein
MKKNEMGGVSGEERCIQGFGGEIGEKETIGTSRHEW